jgi:hypothetical protein
MDEDFFKKKANDINFQLPQNPLVARYLLVVVERGMTSVVNHFNSLEEAERAFNEIANVFGYKPGAINGSDFHEVSVWEWMEGKYEKVYLYI